MGAQGQILHNDGLGWTPVISPSTTYWRSVWALDECLALSQTTGSGPESIDFNAVQGRTYYLIVDSPTGAYSFDLNLTCEKDQI